MHVMMVATYPLTSIPEAVKLYLEARKRPIPDFMKVIGEYSTYGGKGIKAYSIFEIEEGHVEEGGGEILTRMAPFYSVEGYEIAIEWLALPEDALPTLGVEA